MYDANHVDLYLLLFWGRRSEKETTRTDKRLVIFFFLSSNSTCYKVQLMSASNAFNFHALVNDVKSESV
jgi:hypothetical protein